MIIECHNCDAKVDAKVLAKRDYEMAHSPACRALFLECPVCEDCFVAIQELIQTGDNKSRYASPCRVWPNPVSHFHHTIPRLTQQSLEEAQKCFKARAYSACVVMCGRAIETICAEYKTKSKIWALALKN